MGFAQTAIYFATRAKNARDPESAKRPSEVAAFYRRLAGIIPGFPSGFDGARHFGSRADECRA
jgi:hypothetical protein